MRKGLCHNVSNHDVGGTVDKLKVAAGNSLTNKVEMNIDVLRMGMEDGVGR
jgi:hypothetical protein